MARRTPSSIDRLEPQIRDMVRQLCIDQKLKVTDIHARLLELGADVSRSAVGRKVLSLKKAAERMETANAFGDAIGRAVTEKGNDKLLDANIQMLQARAMELIAPEDEENALNTLGAARMSKVLKDVSDITLNRIEAEAKLLKMFKEEAIEAIDSVVKEIPGGLTRDTVSAIKAKILGIQLK